MKYDLTRDFIFFRPLVKGLYIYIYEAVFGFTYILLKMTCQGMWVAQARVI